MGMVPDVYFELFVLANYDDCTENPGCVRRAFNAAVAASHLADHYYNYYKINDPSKVSAYHNIGDFIAYITKKTKGAFKDIRSISNAYKHLYTSTNKRFAPYSSISSTGAISRIYLNCAASSVESLFEDASPTTVEDDQPLDMSVIFTRKDGTSGNFQQSLKQIVDFWNTTLHPK